MSPQGVPLNRGDSGGDVGALHDELTSLGLPIRPVERGRQLFGVSTVAAVRKFQADHQLEETGTVDARTADGIAAALREREPAPGGGHGGTTPPDDGHNGAGRATLTVRVRTAAQTSVSDARVTAYVVTLGSERMLGDGIPDGPGNYVVTYERARIVVAGKQPDVRARASLHDHEIGASEVLYNAPPDATIDIVVPPEAVLETDGDEHGRLIRALQPLVDAAPEHERLGDLQETSDRHDITYLANTTGWDARAVAMAAAADQMSSGTNVPSDLFYALFRAGIPANTDVLARLQPGTVTEIWERSIESGVIAKDLEASLPKFSQEFVRFASDTLLQRPAAVGISSLRDILDAARIDDEQKQQVAASYAATADKSEFWKTIAEQLGDDVASRVATAGRLAYLTVNNAPLMSKLSGLMDGGDPVRLVQAGLYDGGAWHDLLDGVAVPDEIPGKDEAERRANYADFLASQLELSYPTAVAAAMIERKELPLSDPEAGAEVAGFLLEHQGKFELGEQPVAAYLQQSGVELSDRALAATKTLQRQYQLTPSNAALKVMAENKLDSALAATRYGESEFVGRFAESFGGEDTARAVYAKSQQVHSVTFNVATNYLLARMAPGMYSVPILATSPPAANGNAAAAAAAAETAGDVIAYATLEQLFGELDYCTCRDCRSVLSPAAYLVDLLMFCDKRRFNASGAELPATYEKENPLDVLLDRRPDIAELKLTCENTNVALPYVDLVNEVLEHFVVNKSLTTFTGFDVDSEETSADLIASPHHLDPDAYTTLAGESYPLDLPFQRPLAAMRAYIGRVDTTLADTMEALRTSDAMTAGGGGAAYGWRDILIERLGINRGEYRLLTDSSVTLAELYGEDAPDDAATIAAIGNAKTFARRLELEYDEVVELTRTRFVNPQSWLLPRLDHLTLSLATIKAHHDGTITDAELDAKLPTGLDRAPFGGDPRQWLADHYDDIGSLIVLEDPDGTDLCSFDHLRLQHALSGTELTPVEALRLLRFVRLRRRLGWTTDQTDRALVALWPAAQLPSPADDDATGRTKLDTGFAEVLLRIGQLQHVMNELGLTVKRDLPRALALWGPIDTFGTTSLYRQMFLAPSIVDVDAAFAENTSGEVLTAAGVKLVDHAAALEAAFNLKGGELPLVLTALGFDATTDLTIDNITVVFRWAYLARKLRLSVRELIALAQMTALDAAAAPTWPVPDLVQLLEVVARLRDAGVRMALLMYLLQHDLQRGVPAPRDLLALAKTLHDDLGQIVQENAIVEDPSGDLARSKMALVYDQATADTFMGLVSGTIAFGVPYAQLQAQLDPTVVAAAPGLRYDHLAKRLSHAGVLSQAERNAVQGLAAATPALSTAVGDLYTAGQAAGSAFFTAYPELQTLYNTVMAAPTAERAASVLGAFLPDLQHKLQELHVIQSLASDADLTPADVDRLLRDPSVLHKLGDATAPALDDLMAMGRSGASMQVCDGNDVVGVPSTVDAVVTQLDYAPPAHPLPANSGNPAANVSGVWHWRLDPPANGFYSFAIETDAAAVVELRIDDMPVTVAANGTTWETQDAIELRAGQLRDYKLTVKNVQDRLTVYWQSTGLPREVIPAARMIPADLVDTFQSAYTRLLKALGLAAQLELDGEELSWFATCPDLQIGGEGWLNSLPVASGVPSATVQGLFAAVLKLIGYTQLRRDLKLRSNKLLDLVRDPAKVNELGTSVRSDLTGWPDDQTTAVLAHFGVTETDLDDVDELRRVKRVLDCADTIGVPAATLIATTTNDPSQEQLAKLQGALRARYDDEAWYQTVQPVNDVLREQQRNALVAYVLHYLRQTAATAAIDTADKLFEWFLIDVEMEACMKTSRVRQALSSVQLFIQRCLLNLEPRVAASSIESKRWAWMQRYRVWEANRRVYLTPEDWLDPELRDDKSPLYKKLEGELLAADITDESAATALGHYLEGLTEVATLEVDGMFVEEYDSGPADDIVHVVARTAGARRKYFYRKQSRSAWSAWEQIPLDIEDTPAIPVVWRGRLFVFWLRVLEGAPPAQAATTSTADKPLTDIRTTELRTTSKRRVEAMLQWSEYFNGAWQPPHTSDARKPVKLDDIDVDAFDRSQLMLSSHEDDDSTLVISVGYGTSGTYFRLYTPHSLPVRQVDEPAQDPNWLIFLFTRARDFQVGTGLEIDYWDPLRTESPMFTQDVLRRGQYGRVIEPRHTLVDVFGAPFFYEDRRYVLFVRPHTSIIKVPEYGDIVVQPPDPPIGRVVEIPPIRLVPEVQLQWPLPDPGDPYPETVYHGLPDASAPGAFVQSPNIRTEIASVGTFVYGDRLISPAGGLAQKTRTVVG